MRENNKENHVLKVQMFGTFTMNYGGKPLVMKRSRRNNQFTNLMQAMLFYSEKGVGRDWLEDVVFEDRDVENRHNSLRVLIYKAIKKLNELGLPEAKYISLEDGMYRWTPEIKVEVDALEFDRIYQRAKTEEDPGERLELYLQACFMYRGEFLADYPGIVWIGGKNGGVWKSWGNLPLWQRHFQTGKYSQWKHTWRQDGLERPESSMRIRRIITRWSRESIPRRK